MSMKPQPIPEIPPETVRVVRAAFPKAISTSIDAPPWERSTRMNCLLICILVVGNQPMLLGV